MNATFKAVKRILVIGEFEDGSAAIYELLDIKQGSFVEVNTRFEDQWAVAGYREGDVVGYDLRASARRLTMRHVRPEDYQSPRVCAYFSLELPSPP